MYNEIREYVHNQETEEYIVKKLFSFLLALVLILASAVTASAVREVPAAYSTQDMLELVDNDEFYAVISGFCYEEESDEYVAEIYMENHSEDPIEFGILNGCVNGYIVDSYFFNVLAAGRRGIGYFEILREAVSAISGDEPQEVTFTFYIDKTPSGEVENVFKEDFIFYPFDTRPTDVNIRGLDYYKYSAYELENEFIWLKEIDSKHVEDTDFYDVSIVAENRNFFDIRMDAGNMKVNGRDIEPYWYCHIPEGKKGLSHIWIPYDTMQEMGISEVDTLSFTVMIYEEGADDPFFAYPVSFNPPKG